MSGLDNEAGSHRIQRIPPTEKRGRVHTSTVTVSVINPNTLKIFNEYQKLSDDDFRVEWFSGTGKGGQKRNKVKSCCRVIHIPTGMTQSRQGRVRETNLTQAKGELINQLIEKDQATKDSKVKSVKRDQIGSGNRGDRKIRTYRFHDDQVIDHVTGKSARASKVMKGQFNLLW